MAHPSMTKEQVEAMKSKPEVAPVAFRVHDITPGATLQEQLRWQANAVPDYPTSTAELLRLAAAELDGLGKRFSEAQSARAEAYEIADREGGLRRLADERWEANKVRMAQVVRAQEERDGLKDALQWIANDALYKAPEQYADPRVTSRWPERAAAALAALEAPK